MSEKLKVALVKQDVYADLYYCEYGNKKAFEKSLQRSGPMGLFSAFDVDVVLVSAEETSSIWKQKVTCCGHKSFSEWDNVRKKKLFIDENIEKSQYELSIPVDEIDFSIYDIVICIDACIEKRTIDNFSDILWAYYISEPCMNAYKDSLSGERFGYDVFLNQMFRPESNPEYQLTNTSTEIDFPYAFTFPYQYHELFKFEKQEVPVKPKKLKVVVPSYVYRLLSVEQKKLLSERFEVNVPGGNIKQFLEVLCSSNIYLRLGDQGKFGNETVEAVCAGTLFLSTTKGWKNRIFNIDKTTIPGVAFDDEQFSAAWELLEGLDENRHEIEMLASRQRDIATSLCYERPLRYLLKKLKDKRNV